MKKIGICTIIDNDNYGNRLQNFSVQSYLSKFGYDVETINNVPRLNNKNDFILKKIKNYIKPYDSYSLNKNRKNNFFEFNKNIVFSKNIKDIYSDFNNYSIIVAGSDQIWNPGYRLSDLDLLNIKRFKGKKISFSASFGVNRLDYVSEMKVKRYISLFDNVSVRENEGKKILKKCIPSLNVYVLVDPTMLLTPAEWDRISKRPKQLDIIKEDKYILNYFLGDLSESRKKEIERVANEHNCHIINILDKNDPFYDSGPSEFLYLEKHAFLICTDSFHSSVFAILYNRPFIIFDREQTGVESMNSRIDTLISKFVLKNRRYENNITKENLEHDYTEAYKILEIEREKSRNFLEKALDIK